MTDLAETDASPPWRLDPAAMSRNDRILLTVCAVLWLTALGAGVAAVVALVDLGRHREVPAAGHGTPWLLYSVIGVSALVIAVAIPLLVRARRSAQAGEAGATDPAHPPRPVFGDPVAPTSRLRALSGPVLRRSAGTSAVNRVAFPTGAVDQLWFQCTTALFAAIGGALTLSGAATYLMATGYDLSSWIVYGCAAATLLAMPVIPVLALRRLKTLLG